VTQLEPTSTPRVRPRVICHMLASVDGRIVTDGWPLAAPERSLYEQLHASYAADAWICGRVTMEQHFSDGTLTDDEIGPEYRGQPRPDHVAEGAHTSYAVAVDTCGRLRWSSGDLQGDHLIAVLSTRVSDGYLASLRASGVSYILAGTAVVDLGEALHTLATRFGVRTLMLEGGGALNGAMLQAGLVDELSVLLAPVVDGRRGLATLCDMPARDGTAQRLRLQRVDRVSDDLLHLQYAVS
jgi:2,5-diamino-6-(ribosylamino)-4(3H)-pyrimidinone 5'-phosphate reductase